MYDYRYEPKAVALGGGHGLYATLQALRHITRNISAIVTVADDGGSSGRIRKEMDLLPPGDLRMALAALCDDTDWGNTWAKVLQHRFESTGPLNGHSVGNLLISAFWQIYEDPIVGLDWVGKLLDANGRVLPSALVPINISGEAVIDGEKQVISGQANMANSGGHFTDVQISPSDPEVSDEVIKTVMEADWIVLGPGSWYTSVIPQLLVPKLHKALVESKAKRVLNMNLVSKTGETAGMDLIDHINEFMKYGKDFKLDGIIADPASCEDISAMYNIAESYGTTLYMRQVHTSYNRGLHDPLRLASALRDAFEGYIAEIN